MEKLARRCCYVCCCLIVSILVAVAVIAIVLRVVLKPRDVDLSVTRMTLQEFEASLNFPTFTPTLKLVLAMDVRVYNPNRASFAFSNSTVLMFYHGQESARTLVPAGRIPARDSVNISTVLDVAASRVIANPSFAGDVRAGILPVTTESAIKGRVNVWNIYRHSMVSVSKCQILLAVANQTIASYKCENKNIF
ncbi:uncharacterized protein LOC112348383 [Selaginella moellendorffii]|uniref:uncharacterized protein LOC112348383 n=1 Tax=Selaginella moellendorffii TaxID=88036 RepID=UPI000D1C308E|nr:uncharacterized protein LOC9633960 isoform X2 [Selaginella moellendorffii]XP_024526398.1 uncharacterized protein LOC9633960 isoform X2 [Selaginella moellendorffii]XP_024526399.1 uncharacterized protein LOC9633960 isoform X2 [Selaginella moellendorffii]XP_024536533.1 uncharacterized protein LOC112348383 [Selaginella moellendorffii]|eukprot:XP_024526397.1 uncharacterized protein LOC9633960 isoform X2 [Selaginella moellendorffii]